MKKIATILSILALLLLSRVVYAHFQHDSEAKKLYHELSAVALPEGARIIEERFCVGGYISSTGDDIDALAYRVFSCDLSEEKIVKDLSQKAPNYRVFKLDKPESTGPQPPEYFLRRMVSQPAQSAYVIYAVERIDNGLWDWRGW